MKLYILVHKGSDVVYHFIDPVKMLQRLELCPNTQFDLIYLSLDKDELVGGNIET